MEQQVEGRPMEFMTAAEVALVVLGAENRRIDSVSVTVTERLSSGDLRTTTHQYPAPIPVAV